MVSLKEKNAFGHIIILVSLLYDILNLLFIYDTKVCRQKETRPFSRQKEVSIAKDKVSLIQIVYENIQMLYVRSSRVLLFCAICHVNLFDNCFSSISKWVIWCKFETMIWGTELLNMFDKGIELVNLSAATEIRYRHYNWTFCVLLVFCCFHLITLEMIQCRRLVL